MCAGCGVTTAMAPGIAAQIAQCRDGDDEPFRVNLRENGLGDEGAAKIITSVLANPRVTSLDLASNRITSELGEAVKELLTESEVTELDLSENALGNKGVAFISEGIATSQTLRALRINKCDFDSVGAQSLANALGEASGCGWQLETLGLSSNKIGTATLKRSADMHKTGAQSLMHHLATHDKLQTLDLSWNSFGDEGARLFLEAVNERGPPGSLTSLDLSANNLSEEGSTMLAEVFTKCPKLQSLVLNQNMDIGFKGALPFLRLKQEGAIDGVIFGRAASMSSSRPLTVLDAERTVELRGCGCENLPLPTAPPPAPQDGQEGAIPSGAAETTSTDASFAAPGLGSSEQKELLACGIPGWGDELPRMWRTSAPAEAREHMDQLYAARRAERKNSTATDAESAPQEITDPEVDLEAVASREEAEAAEAAAAAQRELQEAEEAENAAKEEWQDVERIEARLRSLEAELEELQQGAAEQAAIDGVVATMASLRKQLQVEVAEAEQADAIAQAERREAEAAAAVAAAEQEEAAAAAALAASKRPAKGKGKRRKGKGQLQVVRHPHLPTLPRTLPHNSVRLRGPLLGSDRRAAARYSQPGRPQLRV